MPTYFDQLNRKIEISSTPRRIVSLVPSQTELLFDLGLDNEVIGITSYCTHPKEWLQKKATVGGTKKIDFEEIEALQPDIIIGNKEENDKEQIERLMQQYNVWMSDIYTLEDAYNMMTSLGALLGKTQESIILKLKIVAQFQQLESIAVSASSIKAAYLIWRKPYMVAGKNTFINNMLKKNGLSNVFSTDELGRYPAVDAQQITTAKPDVILLSSEPFPFKEKHIQELQAIVPTAKVMIVDGEIFSWYGSRLLHTPQYLTSLHDKVKGVI